MSLLRVIESFRAWESHCLECHFCRDFDGYPIRRTEPCQHGQLLIQAILAALRHGL